MPQLLPSHLADAGIPLPELPYQACVGALHVLVRLAGIVNLGHESGIIALSRKQEIL